MDSSPAVPRKEASGEEATFRLRSDSESGGDKGLKRKFLERGTSQGPPETVDTSGPEPLKRPRDEADGDNPRETKRPSPPPEPKSPRRPSPPSPKASKSRSFMAYASTSSPFASVKDQNLFASSNSNKAPSPPSLPAPAAAAPLSAFIPKLGESSTSSRTPTATKRSGFEAFSSSSPFASAIRAKPPVSGPTFKLGRAKSPPRRTNTANLNASPFSSYAGTVQSFAVPMQKRARAGSPNGSARSSLERNPTVGVFSASTTGNNNGSDSGAEDDGDYRPTHTSFCARLRAGKDEDEDLKSEEEQPKVLLEQDVVTRRDSPPSTRQTLLLGGGKYLERARNGVVEAQC